MEVDELVEVVRGLSAPEAEPILEALESRLTHLCDIGLEYLSLNRETDSLSGGESARVKMVKHLTSSLVDVMYIFDEPSVGLHPRDVHRLNELLQKLRDKGNTVLVVEHDPDVIKIADYVVDIGPLAGRRGGEVVFEGPFEALLKAPTLTGRHMKQALPIKAEFRKAKGSIPIRKAKVNNLKNVSVDIPAGIFTVVTGVAGSGKSSLVHQCFVPQHPEAIVIDQSAVGANSRSNPATYTGIMDSVRKAFASANKVAPALFSFNSKGACENCQGLGVVYTDLAYLDEVKLPCEVCGGKRFKDEVLSYKLDGKSISDVLEMTVAQALEFFTLKDVLNVLEAMRDVGLDYLSLGQPLSTLSGGECQRIKLAGELHKKGSLYIMDEPTTGLHMSDIVHLLQIINRIVDAGNTMIVIEHNLDVIRNADWIVDMGPEGGYKGGTVLFQGTPRDLLFSGGSTGSTSGGIKMARHLIVLKNIKNVFIKLNHPKSISFIKLNGKAIADSTNISILSFVVLYLFLFVIGTIIIVFTGVDPVTASSSVATCMAGIGPGLGTVGPMSNFAHIPEIGKIVLSLLMILGRLEIITVFTIFTRTFWKL